MVKQVAGDDDPTGKRKFLVQCLIVIIILFTVLLVFLFINLMTKNGHEAFCENDQCVKAAADIIEQIDQSKDPCKNFYDFACNKLAKEGPMRENITRQIHLMLAEPSSANDSRAFLQEKLFYQRCLDLEAIEKDQDKTILDLFKQLGSFPLLEGHWNANNYYWTDFMVKCRKLGVKFDWFLEFEIIEKFHTLSIKIPNYFKTIPKDNEFHYLQLMNDVAILLGATNHKNYVAELESTIKFETKLIEIAERHREANFLMDKRTIAEIQEEVPNISWLQLIENITQKYFKSTDTVFFNLKAYLDELQVELMGTPKRIQVNYMMWKIIEQFWPYMSRPIREKFENYYKITQRREDFCFIDTKKRFHLVANAEYTRRHVTPEKRILVKRMVDSVKTQLENDLKHVSWLDEQKKTKAINSILNVSIIIGGPDEMFDDYEYSKFLGLSGFEFQSNNIIKMIIERQLKYYEEYYGLLRRPLQVTSLVIDPKMNETILHSILAPMLQDKYFNSKRPDYLNFGTIGTLISYKLIDILYKFSDVYVNWTSQGFINISDCLMKRNGHLQQKDIIENFDDFIAPETSYRTYNYWSKVNEKYELGLPGFNYNNRQLFWIQSGIFLCSRSKNLHEAQLRLENAFMNSENFAKDFHCPQPIDKCKIL